VLRKRLEIFYHHIHHVGNLPKPKIQALNAALDNGWYFRRTSFGYFYQMARVATAIPAH
jgi:hypothetical protein